MKKLPQTKRICHLSGITNFFSGAEEETAMNTDNFLDAPAPFYPLSPFPIRNWAPNRVLSEIDCPNCKAHKRLFISMSELTITNTKAIFSFLFSCLPNLGLSNVPVSPKKCLIVSKFPHLAATDMNEWKFPHAQESRGPLFYPSAQQEIKSSL